jgi:hypothetical protein
MFQTARQKLQARAATLLLTIEGGLDRIMQFWLLFAGMAVATRIAARPSPFIGIDALLPYVLALLAPFASMVLALRWFRDAEGMPQPKFRLARVGRWIQLNRDQAARHPLYGASGIMISLAVGMLLNVPIRVGEYLVSMPPISGHAPEWISTLHALMTLDVVVLSSLYTIAFVAALRRAPLFPRLLALIWVADLAMQMIIARTVANSHGLPGEVAIALQAMLTGNIQKVLISIGLWLPYLLLSARVNVTYRHRIAA